MIWVCREGTLEPDGVTRRLTRLTLIKTLMTPCGGNQQLMNCTFWTLIKTCKNVVKFCIWSFCLVFLEKIDWFPVAIIAVVRQWDNKKTFRCHFRIIFFFLLCDRNNNAARCRYQENIHLYMARPTQGISFEKYRIACNCS